VRVAAERSSALEFFSNGCYNTSAEPEPALTIESLKESLGWFDNNWKPARAQRAIVGIDHGAPGGNETASVVRRVDAGGHVSILGCLTGFPVRTSELLGEPCVPRNPPVPAMKPGPYLKRRMGRWERAHPNRTRGKGEYFIVEERELWCHPDDHAKLKQELELR
jgi:hypothetical protein